MNRPFFFLHAANNTLYLVPYAIGAMCFGLHLVRSSVSFTWRTAYYIRGRSCTVHFVQCALRAQYSMQKIERTIYCTSPMLQFARPSLAHEHHTLRRCPAWSLMEPEPARKKRRNGRDAALRRVSEGGDVFADIDFTRFRRVEGGAQAAAEAGGGGGGDASFKAVQPGAAAKVADWRAARLPTRRRRPKKCNRIQLGS